MQVVIIQRIDGKLVVKLPEGLSTEDFVDFLNGVNPKQLVFKELPEIWTSTQD